jgi:hypothetical protein
MPVFAAIDNTNRTSAVGNEIKAAVQPGMNADVHGCQTVATKRSSPDGWMKCRFQILVYPCPSVIKAAGQIEN